MAVLVEALSVIVRADAVDAKFPGGRQAFSGFMLNQTFCGDGHLFRVGFTKPADVDEYIQKLEEQGLVYSDNEQAADMVIADQQEGAQLPCDWAEFGHISIDGDPTHLIMACRRKGKTDNQLAVPDDWQYEGSLTQHFGLVRMPPG